MHSRTTHTITILQNSQTVPSIGTTPKNNSLWIRMKKIKVNAIIYNAHVQSFLDETQNPCHCCYIHVG